MARQKTLSAKEALDLADKSAASGDKEKAMKYYGAVLEKYPDNQDAMDGVRRLNPNALFRADLDELEVLYKAGNIKEVEVKAKMYIELYPDVYELHNLLGAALVAQLKPKEALPHLKKATELKPFNSVPFFNLANCYKTLGDYPSAIKNYQRTLELKPGNVAALNNLGNVFMMMEDYDNAIGVLTGAAKLAPNSAPILSNAGRALKAKGDYLAVRRQNI